MRVLSASTDDGPPVPSLLAARDAYERAAAWVRPAQVIAAALNTWDTPESAARAACADATRELGVPVTDPVRFGAERIAEAVIARRALRPARTT